MHVFASKGAKEEEEEELDEAPARRLPLEDWALSLAAFSADAWATRTAIPDDDDDDDDEDDDDDDEDDDEDVDDDLPPGNIGKIKPATSAS